MNYFFPCTMRINPSITWDRYSDALALPDAVIRHRNYVFIYKTGVAWAVKCIYAYADFQED